MSPSPGSSPPSSPRLGELRRVLGPLAGAAVCVGMAIGAGILRTPGSVAAALPSAPWIFVVWVLGALVATLDALILAEMASSVPRVGGLVAYLHLSFGRRVAFLVGWSMLLVTWPASLAVVAVATGELVAGGADTLQIDGATSPLGVTIAVLVIAVVAVVNVLGLRYGAGFEIALFVGKVLLLGGVCLAAALAAPAAPVVATTVALPATSAALLAAVGGAMVNVIFTFDGYADAVYLAGETRDPGRALPRALFTALLVITSLYLLANATFLHVLGLEGLAHSKFPALDVARAAFGAHGGTILTVIAVVILLGAVNAYFLTGPRIARVLAEEGVAPVAFGRVPASGAPVWGTVWIALLAAAFALTNTFQDLLDVTVPLISATTALVAVGLLVQRVRAPARPRPFRTPAAVVVVTLQVALSLFLLLSYGMNNSRAVAIDVAAIALGLVMFECMARRRAG